MHRPPPRARVRAAVREWPRRPVQICFQVKCVLDINEIYTLRSKLHRQVYQHRISNVAEAMITDILLAAQKGEFLIKNSAGEMRALHEAAQEPDAFARLTDSILDAIWMTPIPKVIEEWQARL